MRLFTCRTALLLCSMVLLAIPAMPQQAVDADQPTMLRITRFDVKPGQAGDFQDLVRNRIIPAYEKNGRSVSTWRGTALSNQFRFAFVSTPNSFAELDEGAGWVEAMGEGAAASTWARFRDSITSMQGVVDRYRHDLSYRADSDPLTMVILVDLIGAPGKNAEIEQFFKRDVVAAHKKVGSRGFTVRQNIFGGQGDRQWTVAVPIENFAEIDQGSALVRALGQEGWAALGTRIAPLFTSVEYSVVRRVDDLSTPSN
jgi:hypothetical protein